MSKKNLLRDKPVPKGFTRLLMRAPLLLYSMGLGWVLGGRFLKLRHRGRKSARVRETVLEVVGRDEKAGVYYIASGWGEGSHWLRNIKKTPGVGVQIGRRKLKARALRLDREQASEVLYDYALRYPRAFGILTDRILGEKLEPMEENARKMAEYVPVVALLPQ